ncbi:ABC transporter permease subunit [Candidatus Poriferisodalis sp.]|uniref:ABC transporter permease subunit n=1 Tax=Candidatus Poriferisodalis sp. TaxID=3101277 RepID=UPI003B5933CB
MCIFLSATRDNFLTGTNIRTILLTSAVSAIIAVPLGMLLQAGGVDFSVGSTLGIAVILGGRFMSDYGWHPLIACLAVIGVCVGIGAFNGVLCARLRLSPVVVTIGMLFLLRGLTFVLNAGNVRRSFGRGFSYLGRSHWVVLDIPTPVLVAAVWSTALLVLWYRTRWGRHAHAGGIDEDAAVFAGIDVVRSRTSLYTLTAVAAGIGGLIQLSRLDSAPAATGVNLELEVLTAVLLGGVAFSGGFGSAANVLVGVVFLTTLGNGLIQYRVDPNWTRVVEGAVLVASAAFQVAIVKAARRRRSVALDSDRPEPSPSRTPPDVAPIEPHNDAAERPPSISVRRISKRFGAITALDDVSFDVHPGEVVALLGDNGAGKSTLVKVLTGVHRPDEGSMAIGGADVDPRSPMEARELGIEAVQQTLGVVSLFDASQNLFLGRELVTGGVVGQAVGWIDRTEQMDRTRLELARLSVTVADLSAPIASYSGGQRQSIAVARASLWASAVVLLDEPTAALGVEQSEQVLSLVRRLADNGAAVVLVTHDMAQVQQVCDRVVVLRQGNVAADEPVSPETTVERLVGLITGAITADARPAVRGERP